MLSNLKDKVTYDGLSGSTIKIIAMICMLCDHVGAVILDRILMQRGIMDATATTEALESFMSQNMGLYAADLICRGIGRLAFPIFCFLLVEGFLHTRSRLHYVLNLAAFAVISEIPFNLALRGHLIDFTYQNVFFTLTIGLLMLIGLDKIETHYGKNVTWSASLLKVVVILAAAVAAFLLRTDYNVLGIVCIAMIYNLRSRKVIAMTVACAILTVMSLNEVPCFFSLIPVSMYNGKRGLKIKYPFYAFYPVHLLLLYGVVYLMGLSAVMLP